MEQYLNMGIKEVIQRFPEVGAILSQYEIGCITCGVGTCLLKDVVQIHGLPKEQEAFLMAKIERVTSAAAGPTGDPQPGILEPENSMEKSQSEPVKPNMRVRVGYSPPIKKLMEEHERIKRLLALIPGINDYVLNVGLDYKIINDCIYFIRNYADKFHHAKEEEILFKFATGNQEIIWAMIQEHQNGRNYIKSVTEGLEAGNRQKVAGGLSDYCELLQQHIKKEDEILYPWIDRNLSIRQVGELLARFNEVNRKFGLDITEQFEVFLKTLELKMKRMEVSS
ncbi:MAG TPA: hemerythrin domain-containing protein [Bacillota bacterium]|nr:hemerythrin domain-containing protein [Bacillota bacterium]